MDHALDLSNVAVTIYTNKDNKWTHTCETAGAIVYDQPTSAPAELYIAGSAAETEGAAFRKEAEGVFVLYQQLKKGNISFRSGDAEPVKYFTDADNKLFIGARSAEVAASEGVTRITVDFNTNTVKYDQVGAEVKLLFAWTQAVYMTLTYQGNGKFIGEGEIKFENPGWSEERYHFLANVNGSDVVWGRIPEYYDGETRPDSADTPANWFYIAEYPYNGKEADQWTNLWKFASELDNSTATCTINTNENGAFTHSFVKASVDPVPPTMAPAELALHGTGAEVEGQAFRQVSTGVFEIYAKLKDGSLSFKSSNKNYFLDAEKGLLEGAGEGVSTATTDGEATRIRINFQDNTVTFDTINKVRLIWGVNFVDVMTMSYTSAGKWEGEGLVSFVPPGDPTCSWLTWTEQRYYFIPTINGAEEKCWGRKDNVTGNDLYPSDEPDFYDINEFSWSQWDHLWKFAEEMNGATVNVLLDTNKDGVMTHVVTKK
jgi:hypothetical protein